MPGMSGMEVLDQIRVIDPNLLVIVITGYATVESAVEAMKKGAYDFIPKPFTPDQLRIVVRRALERRALQKEAEFLRKEREKSLRDIATEKSKIRTIIHSMGDGVLVCDRDGYLVLTNPAASRLLNVSEESPCRNASLRGQSTSGIVEGDRGDDRRQRSELLLRISGAGDRRHHPNEPGFSSCPYLSQSGMTSARPWARSVSSRISAP